MTSSSDASAPGASVSQFTGLLSRTTDARTRLQFVDSLRAVAILFVFYTHSTEIFFSESGFGRIFFNLGHSLDFGRIGVVLFFAISGFVVPRTLRRTGPGGLGTFIINRIFRLWPAFLISIIPSAASGFWLAGKAFGIRSLAVNATMVPRWFGATMANGAYWTLEVELAFYLLCVILFIGRAEKIPFVYMLLALLGFVSFMSSQMEMSIIISDEQHTGEYYDFVLHLAIMCWAAVFRMWWEGDPVDYLSRVFVVLFGFFWVTAQPGTSTDWPRSTAVIA